MFATGLTHSTLGSLYISFRFGLRGGHRLLSDRGGFSPLTSWSRNDADVLSEKQCNEDDASCPLSYGGRRSVRFI